MCNLNNTAEYFLLTFYALVATKIVLLRPTGDGGEGPNPPLPSQKPHPPMATTLPRPPKPGEKRISFYIR